MQTFTKHFALNLFPKSCIVYNAKTLERAPTSFFGKLVRCSAHGCSFARLRYMSLHLPSASVCTDGGMLQVGPADPDGSSSCWLPGHSSAVKRSSSNTTDWRDIVFTELCGYNSSSFALWGQTQLAKMNIIRNRWWVREPDDTIGGEKAGSTCPHEFAKFKAWGHSPHNRSTPVWLRQG